MSETIETDGLPSRAGTFYGGSPDAQHNATMDQVKQDSLLQMEEQKEFSLNDSPVIKGNKKPIVRRKGDSPPSKNNNDS